MCSAGAEISEATNDPPISHNAFHAGKQGLKAGDPAGALPSLKEALRRAPHNAEIRLALGTALLRLRRPEEALVQFRQIAGGPPEILAAALHGAGLAWHQLRNRDEALNSFRRATYANPDAWRSWNSIADITPFEDERINAINTAAKILFVRCQTPGATQADYINCARQLIEARRPAEVLSLISLYPDQFGDEGATAARIANAHYNLGNFCQAFEQQALAASLSLTNKTAKPAHTGPFKPDAAVNVLRDVVHLFASHGIHLFLTAGTLLGFHRNGGPLPYDRDVDLGVLSEPASPSDIAGILRTHPDMSLPRSARPGDRYFGIYVKGIGVDIFVYEQTPGGVVSGFSYMPGDIQWRYQDFNLIKTDFAGHSWLIPEQPEKLLTEIYGPGWRVPDPGFASAVSSPALYETHPCARAFYAAARARQACLLGNMEKAHQLVQQSPVAFNLPAS